MSFGKKEPFLASLKDSYVKPLNYWYIGQSFLDEEDFQNFVDYLFGCRAQSIVETFAYLFLYLMYEWHPLVPLIYVLSLVIQPKKKKSSCSGNIKIIPIKSRISNWKWGMGHGVPK